MISEFNNNFDLLFAETEISATKTMISEPSFQPNSLDFLLGRNQTHVPEGRQTFSLAARKTRIIHGFRDWNYIN